MRNLLYKNIVSQDGRRRIICSSEKTDKEGIHSVIKRHLIYTTKEIRSVPQDLEKPHVYIWKECNHKEMVEKFFCKIKRNLCVASDTRIFLITFVHTLKISLSSDRCALAEIPKPLP